MNTAPNAVKTKIAIADDHAMFRKGIIKLLDPEQYELLFDVANGKEVLEKINTNGSLLPDLLIMDIEMPRMNGYETVAWLKENKPEIKILVVSMVDHEEAIIKMLKLGVRGYLSKNMEPEDLYAALQAIISRDYYFTDFVTNKLIDSLQREDPVVESLNEFSPVHKMWHSLNARQKEYVKLACTEMTYSEIADKMCVSPKTIDGYRDVVFERFNVKSRPALMLFAIKNKIVTI
jgi:two-component system, NarL family, invasion response regulator UvrY